MSNELLSDLKSLLIKYPELASKRIIIDQDGMINMQPSDDIIDKKCSVASELPSVYRGTTSKIEVRKSRIHGYGIFANDSIAEGELIEECKLLRLGWRSKYLHDPVLADYMWANKQCGCVECKNHGYINYIALGNGSLYNHSDNPNTTQTVNFKNEVMTIISAKEIKADEEIFVHYGEKYWIIREFWKKVNASKQLEKFHKENIKPFIRRDVGQKD